MTGAGLLSVALLSRCSRAGHVPGLPARSARAGPAGSPAPSSYGTAFEPCRRTLSAFGCRAPRAGAASSHRSASGCTRRRRHAACRLRPARLFAVRCAARPVASDDRPRDAASRRAVLVRRGAALCSVSRLRFDESARRAAAAPRRIGRLRATGAGQSAGLRRHVRGGAPPFLSSATALWSCACSRAAPRFRAHAPARDSSFRGARMDQSSTEFMSVARLRPPRHPRRVPGPYAVAAGCRSRASGRDRTQPIPRLCCFGPPRRSRIPSPLACGVSLKMRRFGARPRSDPTVLLAHLIPIVADDAGRPGARRAATRRYFRDRRCGPGNVAPRSPDGLSGGCPGTPSRGRRFPAI